MSSNRANYVIAVDGKFDRVFGTSASAPALGAMLYAINDARLAIGKKPIGFINPAVSVLLLAHLDDISGSVRGRFTRPTSKTLSTISRTVQTQAVVRKVSARRKVGTRYLG